MTCTDGPTPNRWRRADGSGRVPVTSSVADRPGAVSVGVGDPEAEQIAGFDDQVFGG